MNLPLALVVVAAASATNLQLTLDELRDRQDIPGVSAVVTTGRETVYAGASGFADLETQRAMTPDTILYAGSLTKIFTAVLTLQLIEDGALNLDDVVFGIAEHESVINRSDIQLKHLLTHASGLEREGNFGYWFTAEFPDRDELAEYLRGTELRTEPGQDFHYSNIGYATLGIVAEDASSRSFADLLHDRVFVPLGMASSGAPGPAANIAAGYSPVGRVIPSQGKPFAGLGRNVGDRRIREYHDASAMTPAFGAYTSARDLSRLGMFLLGFTDDEVLSEEIRTRMLSAQESGWGLGIKIDRHNGRLVARHSGWFAAHRSHLILDLESGVTVAVMANSDNASPNLLAEALLYAAHRHIAALGR